jgi:hypothetical protein
MRNFREVKSDNGSVTIVGRADKLGLISRREGGKNNCTGKEAESPWVVSTKSFWLETSGPIPS